MKERIYVDELIYLSEEHIKNKTNDVSQIKCCLVKYFHGKKCIVLL